MLLLSVSLYLLVWYVLNGLMGLTFSLFYLFPIFDDSCPFWGYGSSQLQELKLTGKTMQDEPSTRLASLDALQAKLSAEPLTFKEMMAKALKVATQILDT